jgi:Glycosyl hydrolase family 57
MPLNLFSVFHLNLAYSSIEEEDRVSVIQRCYWPLLKLSKELRVPIGIEATGSTLESIADISPAWVEQLRDLINEGLCEFIGSGYAQIIGPLVPAEVNAANLRFGNHVYKKLLGCSPSIGLINEQAYSSGLIDHYVNAGFKAMMMEWDNPFHEHPTWNPEWRYYPQIACGASGQELPIIWNKSIAFQKFQRFVHGDLEWKDYLAYLTHHAGPTSRVFPLYGNDAEVFNYRPGRYLTEAVPVADEWERIRFLVARLKEDDRFQFIRPSETLNFLTDSSAGHRLSLESPQCPIPVKKQAKYNVLRWAVTGRDDAGINAACFRAYEAIKMNPFATDHDWQELCYLWSSDFRTHITKRRWVAYQKRLHRFQINLGLSAPKKLFSPMVPKKQHSFAQFHPQWDIRRCGQFLEVENSHVKVRVNCRRGLAIDGFWVRAISPYPLIGTLHHGFYDDISMGADFYTGHLVLESPGRPKLTDLTYVEPEVAPMVGDSGVDIHCVIPTRLGSIEKTLSVGWNGDLRVRYALYWNRVPAGALRIWPVTLLPNSFDRGSLTIQTHNGGFVPEAFSLSHGVIDHSRSVSFLVSANSGLGMTEGTMIIGDSKTKLAIAVKQSTGYLVPLVTTFSVGESYFSRVAFSASECDDTTRQISVRGKFPKVYELSLVAQSQDNVKEYADEKRELIGAAS